MLYILPSLLCRALHILKVLLSFVLMKSIAGLIILWLLSCAAHGQGCSDAGFCTMGAMKPDQPFNKRAYVKLRSVDVSFYRGTTTLTPIVYVATAEFNVGIGSKNSLQLKVPYQLVKGRLGETSSLSDLSLCFTRSIYTSDDFDVNFSVGGKVPTNNSNILSAEGLPLPMYYQTSLGTFDFIAGIAMLSRRWLLATGVQVPLNENGNRFLWKTWEASGEDQLYVLKYAQANQLRRGVDVMLRVERNFRFARFNASLGLLPIYRLNRDQIVNANDEKVNVANTHGLALSGIATIAYHFDVRSAVRLLVGHKIVEREKTPDGLTRNLVSSIGYSYRF